MVSRSVALFDRIRGWPYCLSGGHGLVNFTAETHSIFASLKVNNCPPANRLVLVTSLSDSFEFTITIYCNIGWPYYLRVWRSDVRVSLVIILSNWVDRVIC